MRKHLAIALIVAATSVSACQVAPDGRLYITPYPIAYSVPATEPEPVEDVAPDEVREAGLVSGIYVGQREDGGQFIEEVSYDGDYLYVRRYQDSVPPTVYRRADEQFFQDQNGSVIMLVAPDRFIWANRHGENLIEYTMM